MDGDLYVIFSLNNDATRTWLSVFGLADCFDEDDNVLAISFDSQITAERRYLGEPDILLLYDMIPDRSMIDVLTPYVQHHAKIFAAFHRGLDTPVDRSRILTQREKLSSLCGKKLIADHLIAHSTCGSVYGFLKDVAKAVKTQDRKLYRSSLTEFRLLFGVDSFLEEKLAFLHDASTPGGAAELLTRAEKSGLSSPLQTLLNRTVSVANTAGTVRGEQKQKIMDLVFELSDANNCFSEIYLDKIKLIKSALINE